jgi:hypothetical protein
MEKEQKVRILRKFFRKISSEADEGYKMGMLMGGGECSAEICEHYHSSLFESQQIAFLQIDLTEKEYSEELKRIIKIESLFFVPRERNDCPKAYYDLISIID